MIIFLAFPILPAGLVGLKLRQFLLQTELYFVAFLRGEAEIIETSSIGDPSNVGNFSTP